MDELVKLYLQGPQNNGLYAPFPADTTIRHMKLDNGVLYLELSADLTGMERTLSAACLVSTMTQFEAVDAVNLTCSGVSNQGVLGQNLTMGEFLSVDDTATSDQTTVKLYFPDASGRYLEEETRQLAFDSEGQIPGYIVRQLLDGPAEQNHGFIVPDGTKLNTIWIRDGICTVDLSLEFIRNLPETHQQARMTVFSLVNSLTELEQVEAVVLQSVGQSIRNYGGMDLSQPLYREDLAIAQERDDRRVDTTLYLSCGEQNQLAAVPVMVNRTTGRSLEADVLNALLAYEAANGYESPVSDGVMVAELNSSNGLCRVTFNSAFALCDADPKLAQKAVQAVVCTLCALENVDQVQISVSNTELTNVDLSEPLSPDASWYMD